MEMFALTFLSWEVMSALGWLFLVVGGVVLVVGSDVVGIEDWPDGGGTTGSRWLGLTVGVVGL